jgi:hypothetical protein
MHAAPSAEGAEFVSGRLTVVHAGDKEKAARYVADLGPGIIEALEADLGGRFDRPVTVVLLEGNGRQGPHAPTGLPSWFAGAAVPGAGTIYLKLSSAMKDGPADIRRTLAHELAHLYLRWRVAGHPLPRWLDEGLAMRASGEYDLSHRWSLTLAALAGDVPPLYRLEERFPDDEAEARLAYAAGFSFTGFILRRGGKAGLVRLLDVLGTGDEFGEAFRHVYGFSLEEAENLWRRDLRGSSRWISAIAGGSSLWMLVTLLFLLVSWRKRRLSRIKLEAMDEEEEAQRRWLS